MADVRISTHLATTQNRRFTIIKFYDGLENLIGTNYVIIDVRDNRLYFCPAEEKYNGALRLKDVVNVWRLHNLVEPFEGDYSLEFDSAEGLYYVDKTKKSEITRFYANNNVPHPNYKAHTYEPYVVQVIDSSDGEKRKYPMSVYDGLLTLLRSQIEDLNKQVVHDVLSTIKSLVDSE